MTIHINITPHHAMPPDGYILMRVRKWGDPIMVAQADCSVYKRYAAGQEPVGTFQVVELHTPPIGDWSAVTKYNRLTREDMLKVARAQLIAFGRADLDPIRDMTVPLSDGWTLKQKMGWMYQSWSGGPTSLTMWGQGEWWEEGEKRYGTMVNGGEMVAVSEAIHTFYVRLRGETTERDVTMRRLLPFRRADLDKDPRVYPWLWQRATCVYKGDDTSIYTPKGLVYLPVALDWREFDISGAQEPTGYFLPIDWMESVQ
jgi:hypothetical protein